MRLSAILRTAPLVWCAWEQDGTFSFHPAFPVLIGAETLKGVETIQDALSPSDAAALEQAYARLRESGEIFSIDVTRNDRKTALRLTGVRSDPETPIDILWAEDTTEAHKKISAQKHEIDRISDDHNRLQSTMDQIPQPLWMRNAQTDIIWCNRAYARDMDTSPATVIAEQKELPLKLLEKKSPGARPPGRILAQDVADTGKAAEFRGHVVLGGKRRLMRVVEIPLPGVNATLGMAIDITREEELETDQKRYAAAHRELLEQLGTAIGIFDSDQKLEFYNTSFAQLWGVEEQYLNGKPKLGDLMEKLRTIRRLPEQADFRKFKQGWLNMFTGLIGPHEDMLHLPSGNAIRMLTVPHPMGGLMMTFEDVTSRLELESSYNTLVAVQKETLDNLAEGIALFGGNGRIKLWNPSFARLWGLNPEDLLGQPHISVLTEKMKIAFKQEEWPQRQKELMAQGIERKINTGRMERADDSHIYFSTLPLPDGSVLVTHADITDSARIEHALREKNAALEAAERLKLDFLANVSYQLRTPLNAIIGFSELLAEQYFGPLNKRQEEYTASIHDAGQRLISLVDDILDLSTIEAGYMQLEQKSVPVQDIVKGVSKLTADWAGKEKINLMIACKDNVGSIHADERRIKQALINLVSNAINFTPAGGSIVIAAAKTPQGIEISVSDTGSGIDPADQARIFEPFEKAGGTAGSGRIRGAGLGLALVRNIVALHGGTVTLDSGAGKGSTFRIILPAAEIQLIMNN